MFLLYRNQGARYFGRDVIAPHPRHAWEFQFVLEGECSMLIRNQDSRREERLIGPVLCITAPDFVHGFGGRPSDVCQIICFHFDEVDFAIRALAEKTGYRVFPFSSKELPDIQSLYDRCAEARSAIGTSPPDAKKRAGFLEPLIYDIVALELTLFALKHTPKSELGSPPDYAENKVSEALIWYSANLRNGPAIEDVARAVHISPTHLRRLFRKIRGISPQEAFTRVQFERVKWLMDESSMPLERIGESAGFGSASAFSRAFKREFGVPPNEYRKKPRKRK